MRLNCCDWISVIVMISTYTVLEKLQSDISNPGTETDFNIVIGYNYMTPSTPFGTTF